MIARGCSVHDSDDSCNDDRVGLPHLLFVIRFFDSRISAPSFAVAPARVVSDLCQSGQTMSGARPWQLPDSVTDCAR